MPHTPRRSPYPEPDPATVVTDEQIAAAMEKAVALRRRTARNPEDVQPQPLDPYRAVRFTESDRSLSYWHRLQREGRADPWYLVGWVNQETRCDVDHCGVRWCGYRRAWDVYLHVGDGRVWLRPSRGSVLRDPANPYP